MNDSAPIEIQTVSCPQCPLCDASGELLYAGLTDRLYQVPGAWNFKKCSKKECGTLWLDPMPRTEDLEKLYVVYLTHGGEEAEPAPVKKLYLDLVDGYLAGRFGKIATPPKIFFRWAGKLLYLHPGRRTVADAQVLHIPAGPAGRLLDVGCGSGKALKRLQGLGWQVEGVDFDPAAVASARARGLEVNLGDLFSREYPENVFDVVTMSHVIEHVPAPVALLEECFRILKPGGRLILSTPNGDGRGHRRYGKDWRGLESPRHLQIFTPRALAAIAKQAGFLGISCKSLPNSSGIRLESRMLQQRGRVEMPLSPSVLSRVWSIFSDYGEWFLHLLGIETGDELLLLARK